MLQLVSSESLSWLQSIHEICYLRNLFPEHLYEDAHLKNLDGVSWMRTHMPSSLHAGSLHLSAGLMQV